MDNIESEGRGLKLGLPAGSWWRLHWTLAWAGAGRHQRSLGELGLGKGQQQLLPQS